MNIKNRIASIAINVCYITLITTQVATPQIQPLTPRKMVVTVPVADVRREPKNPPATIRLPICSSHNPLQETQVLYGEHLLVLEENENWIHIQAMEQQRCRNGIWQGYPGWIKKEQAMAVETFPTYNLVVTKQWATLYDEKQQNNVMSISFGTKLLGVASDKKTWTVALFDGTKATIAAANVYALTQTVTEDVTTLRKLLISHALTLENALYSWGGRSAQNDQLLVSGVDCAGLINICYRSIGLDIPRDANDIILQTIKITNGKAMQPGDLVFIAHTANPKRMGHVMMYLGNELLLETTFSVSIRHEHVDHVRTVTATAKLDIPLAEIVDGQAYGPYIIHLRSLLGSQELINKLRSQAIKTSYN